MKKIRWATHKGLFKQIASLSCLAGGTTGIVFGIAGSTFKIQYIKSNDAEIRINAALNAKQNYYSQDIVSKWNMSKAEQPTTANVDIDWWRRVYGLMPLWSDAVPHLQLDPAQMLLDKEYGEDISGTMAPSHRYKYNSIIIDGAAHSALDRSFNQGLYTGLANFNNNKDTAITGEDLAQIYKPSQDNTQEFKNIYRAAASKCRILCLAGFNHVTATNALGTYDEASGTFKFEDPNIGESGLMLIDGDIPNNQNLASVLFRSDQPAFLAALATCMYFYNNLNLYHDKYQDLTVATYGGTQIPTVVIYMGGFQRGIEFFNEFILRGQILYDFDQYVRNADFELNSYFVKKLLPASKYKDEVEALRVEPESLEKDDKIYALTEKLYQEYSIKMIKLGDFASHFTGTFADGDAIGISKQLLNRGASAIIPVAAGQVHDTAQEVMNQHSNAIVLGVDTQVESGDYQRPFTSSTFKDRSVAPDGSTSQQAGNIVKFSAVKDMSNISRKMLTLAATGKNWDYENNEPWNCQTSLPQYDESKYLPEDKLKVIYVEPTGQETSGTFKVVGFNQAPSEMEGYTAIRIPTRLHKGENNYFLSQIGYLKGETAPEYPFNYENTKQFELIDFGSMSDDAPNITFADKAFDFTHSDSGFDYGFKYVDVSTLVPKRIKVENQTATEDGRPFYNMTSSNNKDRCFNKGIMKLPPADAEETKINLFKALTYGISPGSETSDSHWYLSEADPLESICSFGYKTCGNIENGLISISWDGWYFLLEALRHVKFEPSQLSTSKPFMDYWEQYAAEYCQRHKISTESEFYKTVVTDDWTKLSTFNPDSILNKNYTDLMGILGLTLKNACITFPKYMTVAKDIYGHVVKAESTKKMSVLEWLKTNMYYIA